MSAKAIVAGDSEALKFKLTPKDFVVRAGHARRVKVTVRAPAAASSRLVTGTIDLRAAGHTMHVPWAMPATLLGDTLTLAYPSKRYRSAWIGIAVHSAQSVFFAILILTLVV